MQDTRGPQRCSVPPILLACPAASGLLFVFDHASCGGAPVGDAAQANGPRPSTAHQGRAQCRGFRSPGQGEDYATAECTAPPEAARLNPIEANSATTSWDGLVTLREKYSDSVGSRAGLSLGASAWRRSRVPGGVRSWSSVGSCREASQVYCQDRPPPRYCSTGITLALSAMRSV
jgi:hypothetical protein